MAHWFDDFSARLAQHRTRRDALKLLVAGLGTSLLGCSSSTGKPAQPAAPALAPRTSVQLTATPAATARPTASPT